MLENLNEAVGRRRSGVVVFALIDLDGFREVNDTLGRAGGDAVLTNIGEHLQAGLPKGALLGRFEEDQFAVIMSGDDKRAATALSDALRAALLRPIFMDRMWQITAGIGVAQAPEDGTTAEEVARRAGLALRVAKREGRGRMRSFAPQIETDYAERRFLLRELQSAIALRVFDVHYQPVVAAEGGAIIEVEALARWTHPTRGAIGPSVFIPLAEESGLMSQLGEIVLRRALSDGVRWPNLSVAVNLSPLQIRDRGIVDLVGTVIAETGIAPSRVVLEITEGILIDNPQDAQTRLEALRALGVRIAVSYTHLYASGVADARQMAWGDKGTLFVGSLFLGKGTVPVSYTHLDVYKRQLQIGARASHLVTTPWRNNTLRKSRRQRRARLCRALSARSLAVTSARSRAGSSARPPHMRSWRNW